MFRVCTDVVCVSVSACVYVRVHDRVCVNVTMTLAAILSIERSALKTLYSAKRTTKYLLPYGV